MYPSQRLENCWWELTPTMRDETAYILSVCALCVFITSVKHLELLAVILYQEVKLSAQVFYFNFI